MCGIAGILSPNPRHCDTVRLQRGMQALHHRGPEQEGIYRNKEGRVLLGHKRLCIIDLSDMALQPMSWQDRYHIVYNGEIYNYTELREALRLKGYSFRSQSDTEVILAAYACYGESCLEHFEGMFAFAIWDEEKKELFAARDRFGEKPFYFYHDEKELVFGSELKALWAMQIPKQVNRSMLYNFISLGYTINPAEPKETFFDEVYQLPPAYKMIYSMRKGELVLERYWELETHQESGMTDTAAGEQFIHLLQTSIQRRMRSDVPLGTSLSGGLDSSSILALSQSIHAVADSHKALTAVFEGFEKNERQQAATVASRFHLEHHLVTIQAAEVGELMEKVMQAQDEPIASASALAQYKVFQRAKEEGVTVMLDGQGADEILAGYTKYFPWYWRELKASKQKREIALARANGIQERWGWKERLSLHFPELAAALRQSQQAKKMKQHPDWHPDFANEQRASSYYSLPASFDLNGALYFNTIVTGLSELLRMADRNSMAHSVEVRLPFLDHHLVEFLFHQPADRKIRDGWSKWLLRSVMQSRLPEAIVWRKDKVGYEPPQKTWMQQPEVQDRIREGKKKLAGEGILRSAALNKKIQPHDAHAAESREWKYWSASRLFDQAL